MRNGCVVSCMLAALVTGLISPSIADIRILGRGSNLDDGLLYADLVVQGTIESLTFQRVRQKDYFGLPARDPQRLILIESMTLQVIRVLKGSYGSSTVPLFSMGSSGLREGDEYILGLRASRVRKGEFVFRNIADAYVKATDGWFRPEDGKWFTYDQIKSITESTRIENVTRNADLIAVGTVAAVREYEYTGSDGHGEIRECTVEVDSLFKGTLEGQKLIFKMVTAGSYFPVWRTQVPLEINAGELWYLFLKRGDIEGGPGYYAFAGVNGLLKIEGQRLIYDLRVDLPQTKDEVDALVRKQIGE